MAAELFIQNQNTVYFPAVEDGVTWTTNRQGSPGQLTFKAYADNALNIEEGNAVVFRWNGADVFYGFIFSLKCDRENILSITAYDQLRYFKNKDTYQYTGKKANEVIQMIAADFNLQCGALDDSGYVIPFRNMKDKTLFDISSDAIEQTLLNTGNMFVLYDDFGKLALKNISNMQVPILIDEETGENFDFSSSIDDNTYNQIKLYQENKDTGVRDIYMAKHGENINKWGVLQYYETLGEGENGQSKADALLKLYNQKTRKLTVKGAFGDTRVRAGSLVGVILTVSNNIKINNQMLVETCKHSFKADEHRMDLTLRGSIINAA